MSDNGAKAPTEQSTSPMGNFRNEKPTPLATGLGPNASAKLKDFLDQKKRIADVVSRKAK